MIAVRLIWRDLETYWYDSGPCILSRAHVQCWRCCRLLVRVTFAAIAA